MRSRVADEFRREQEDRAQRLSPAQRMALALELWAQSVDLYVRAHPGVNRAEARRRLVAERHVGRRASACARP